MKTTLTNAHEWLQQEAHLTTLGRPFHFKNCSCLPVTPESIAQVRNDRPSGFLITHGEDVAFVPCDSPDGAAMAAEWEKFHLLDLLEDAARLPSECWVG